MIFRPDLSHKLDLFFSSMVDLVPSFQKKKTGPTKKLLGMQHVGSPVTTLAELGFEGCVFKISKTKLFNSDEKYERS